MPAPTIPAAAVVDALRDMYGVTRDLRAEHRGDTHREWALLTEVPLRVPKPGSQTWFNERRIDVLLARTWASGRGHDRLAIEVKVTRSDYRSETDAKRAPAWAAAHRCAYAAPAGVIDPVTLPEGWGLIEVYPVDNGLAQGRWRHHATRHQPTADLDYLIAACARIGSRHAEHLRRGDTTAAEVANLRRQVTSLTGQLERSRQAVYRERNRVRNWRGITLAVEGMQTCADCGQPIAAKRDHGWRHRDKTIEPVCEQARAEAERQRRQEVTGSAYVHSLHYAPPIVPARLRDLYAEETMEDSA